MRILRASALGMCFGVRDAIALALEHADTGPLTILGDLVHNAAVLAALRDQRHRRSRADVTHVQTQTVMVTAHGASERTLASTRALGLEVVEATCPLVHVAHRAIKALVRDGYHPVIVGQRDHVEVRGLTEDLDEFDVVLDEEDVLALDAHPRIGVAAQTTQPIEQVRHLVALIRRRFPQSDVRFIDTVCQPTKQRQTAAVDLARQCDVVIVVGGANSNNTRELVNTCRRHCSRGPPRSRPSRIFERSGSPPQRRWASRPARRRRTSHRSRRSAIRARRRSRDARDVEAAHDAAIPRARALAGRRGVCHRHGMGRGRQRLLPSRPGRSARSVSAEPAADASECCGQVELVREAATLVMLLSGRHARRPDLARAGRIRSDRVRRLGHFLLRVPADRSVTGRSRCSTGTSSSCCRCPGGGRCSRPSDRVADDRGRHVGEPVRGRQSSGHCHGSFVVADVARHRARALRVHGRLASRVAPRTGRHEDRCHRRSTGRCSAWLWR